MKNFPPIPSWFPCRPCFYQDINVEIPGEFQIWVRYLYYLWSRTSILLLETPEEKTCLLCSLFGNLGFEHHRRTGLLWSVAQPS